ncbi:MAG: imidazolonepropionase [Parachlamydiaceae bacterium]|nr:imidazolonepropionase [Parachlamydiaceae bacterium]
MEPETPTLIGPFSQILTMENLPQKGPIFDSQLKVISNGAIAVNNGLITDIGEYDRLKCKFSKQHFIDKPAVALPGFIDSHTHLVFAGSRASDYALRVSGRSYLEIAKNGGGILDTVSKTRAATKDELIALTLQRCQRLIKLGISTCEVKSGYGLSVVEEIKILEVVAAVNRLQPVTLIPTCLAAHTRPLEFKNNSLYLSYIAEELLPILIKKKLCRRIDIFVDETAFNVTEARDYLLKARSLGFELCLHADQFRRGGAQLAAELKAVSADHLENSTVEDFKALAEANVVAIALPGAALGLGIPQPHARQMLDNGLSLAIASDWNPGSAPMGNLLVQAAILSAAEHLTIAETLAAITFRAANALQLTDRGCLAIGRRADIAIFPTNDYRDILYYQGSLLPSELYIYCP